MRVLVYISCASSDPMHALDAMEQQMARCSAYAEEHGLEIVDVLTDLGVGVEPGTREGFTELLDLAEQEDIDAVLTESFNRISRYWVRWQTIRKTLTQKGVRILTTSPGFAA